MSTKVGLAIGDKIAHRDTPSITGRIVGIDLTSHTDKGGYVKLSLLSHPITKVGTTTFWYYDNCILVKEKEETKQDNLCSCTIEVLMGKGCSCGGS